MADYKFSNVWFQNVRPVWDQLITNLKPEKILEIGSYEGASACYLIEKISAYQSLELNCIDTWEGGIEHRSNQSEFPAMSIVEERFHNNIAVAKMKSRYPASIFVHKSPSDDALTRLLVDGKKNYFDLIYIDGSHQAPDVLFDAVIGFKLLKINGLMIFDDYTWFENLPYGKDPLRCPKPAIDSFVNLNFRKLKILNAPLLQLYIIKTSD